MKNERKDEDNSSNSGDSADNSLDVSALMNMLHDIKRTKMHNRNTVEWLRKRYNNRAKAKYLYFPEEVLEQENIKNIFDTFDDNNNQILEMGEMLDMFKQYNIKMTREDLEEFFSIVDEDNDRALNFKEFKNCALSEKANVAFFRIMRKIREKEEARAKALALAKEGVKMNEMNADTKTEKERVGISRSLVVYNKEGSGLRAGGAGKNNHQRTRTHKQKQEAVRVETLEEESELSYLPVSFGSMVSYLSYKVLREKLLKSIEEGTLAPSSRVEKLFELFRLSKIYQKDEEERKDRNKLKGNAKKSEKLQEIKRKTARISALQNVEEISRIGAKRSSAFYNSNLYHELRKRGVSLANNKREIERPDSVLQSTTTIEEELSTAISKAKEKTPKLEKEEQSGIFSNNKSRRDLFLPELESPKFFAREKIMFLKSESCTSKSSVDVIPRKLREVNKMMQEGVRAAKLSSESKAFHRIIRGRNNQSMNGPPEEFDRLSRIPHFSNSKFSNQSKSGARNFSLPLIKGGSNTEEG